MGSTAGSGLVLVLDLATCLLSAFFAPLEVTYA